MLMRRSYIYTKLGLLIITMVSLLSACVDTGNNGQPSESFDRQAMLTFWAEQQIVPAYKAFGSALGNLVTAKDDFLKNRTQIEFQTLRTAFLNAYLAWQPAAMFNIGKAEAIGYRNFVNTYPTDVDLIESNINAAKYNLELPSNFDAQGLPALDYLLFGMYNADGTNYAQKLGQSAHLNYINDLVDRLFYLNQTILNDWEANFKATFIKNNGSSATASTDKMVNDFLFYYEKYFRAGKVGIPAGVFTGNTLSHTVEAPYAGIYSKQLCLIAFDAIQKFFNGESLDGSSTGPSLKQYLESVAVANNLEDIAQQINNQWQLAEEKILALDDNFKQQTETDHLKMLAAYDEIQKTVVMMKVDMMQALNIQIDYVDADGD